MIAVLALLITGGCGSGDDETSPSAKAETTTRAVGGSTDAERPAPTFPPLRRVPDPQRQLGDGSVQRYGESADDEVYTTAASTAQTYYAAMLTSDWRRACQLLSPALRDSFKQLAEGAPGGSADCPAILRGIVGSDSQGREELFGSRTRFTDLRVQNGNGYLLFESPALKDGFISMVFDDGAWKVSAVRPTGF